MVALRFDRVQALPQTPAANTVYFVKPAGVAYGLQYITGNDGVPVAIGSPVSAQLPPFDQVVSLLFALTAKVDALAGGIVTPTPTPSPTLSALTLAATSITENATSGTVIGGILGRTTGSTLTLVDTLGGRFALSGTNLVVGTTAIDYEAATSHSITIRETLAGASNSPRDTPFTIGVINQFEAPNLSALSFANAGSLRNGTTATGAISGATAGSTITASGLPAGFTINGPARTWAFDGTTAAGSTNITLTETLGDSANSPRQTGLAVVVAAQVTIAFSSTTASVAEGNSGTTAVTNTINVVRNGLTGALTVNLSYSGTANGSDYTGPSTVTIPSGASSVAFDVTINGDNTVEPDETIIITATLAGYSATATKTITVTNDDAAPVNAPTLTKTSAAGANPIAFTMASDNTVQVGMYVRLELSQDGVTKSDGGYQTVFRTEERQIRSDDIQPGGELSFGILSNLPDGAIYAHVQVSRDDGVKSAWSNSVSDVMSSAPVTTLDPATKSAYITLSNGNLTMAGNNDVGAFQSVKSSTSRGAAVGDFYFEAVTGNGPVQQGASARTFGVCPASVPTDGNNFKEIGGNSAGLGWFSGGDRYDLRANNAGQYYEYPPSWQAVGTVVGCLVRVSQANGTRKVYLHKNGVWLSQLGDPYAGTPGPGAPIDGTDPLFAFGSCTRDDTLIFRFKASQQTYKPANATAWGG